ncbi:hypothetical protein D9M72_529410 [compost metagenome]
MGLWIEDAHAAAGDAQHLAHMPLCRNVVRRDMGPDQPETLPIPQRCFDLPVRIPGADAVARNATRDGFGRHSLLQQSPDIGGRIVQGKDRVLRSTEQNILPPYTHEPRLGNEARRRTIARRSQMGLHRLPSPLNPRHWRPHTLTRPATRPIRQTPWDHARSANATRAPCQTRSGSRPAQGQ